MKYTPRRILIILKSVLGRDLTKKEQGMLFGYFKAKQPSDEKIFHSLAKWRKQEYKSVSLFLLYLSSTKEPEKKDLTKLKEI